MDLGELIARDLIKGFSHFKPDSISFEGENLMLIYRTLRRLIELSQETLIYGRKSGTYIINIDKLASYCKKRRSDKEVSFRSYWGEDIPFEHETSNKFFVSSVPLSPERDVIYKKVAKTAGGALKVTPYKRKGNELIPLTEIYLLEKQHLSDRELSI